VLLLAVVGLACASAPTAAGTPIAVPADLRGFLKQFQGPIVVQFDCALNAPAKVVNCGERGVYRLSQEPPSADRVICRIMQIDKQPRGLVCSTLDEDVYYEIPVPAGSPAQGSPGASPAGGG
jgi:hypothetical protein